MAPPVSVSQSWRGAPAVAPATNSPDVLPSSTTMASSGSVVPMAAASVSVVKGPDGRSGRAAGAGVAPSGGAPSKSARASSAPGASSPGRTRVCTVHPGGTRSLALPG